MAGTAETGEMENCPVVQQAVGWALHALEPDEELVVAAHIPGCPICQAAVRDTEEVVAGLGAVSEPVEPPPSLRTSLMAAVAETPQVRVPATDTRPPEPRRIEPVDRGKLPASWLTRRRLVAAALALVAVVAVGGLAVRNAQTDPAPNTQTVAEVIDQLVPPGTRHAVLATADGAQVGAVVLDQGQREVITVGMPANPSDHTYVLWGVGGQGAPVPLGTFDVNATDAKIRSVGSGADSDGFTAYAVSLERGRTAPAAPSSVMAEGRLV
jgi:anti-sigma-K factor RskA